MSWYIKRGESYDCHYLEAQMDLIVGAGYNMS